MKCVIWVIMSNHALSFNDHFLCTGWQTITVFVFSIIYKLLLTSWTGIFLFNIMLTEVDTFTTITHHYSNANTQFITQFITQIPLLKSLLIITQMPFSLLIITPPLLKGHFADGDPYLHADLATRGMCNSISIWFLITVQNLAGWAPGSIQCLRKMCAWKF